MQKSKIKNQNYPECSSFSRESSGSRSYTTTRNSNIRDNSKFKNKEILERAISFHGHLGPYLILGLLMGDLAINRLRCKKHFGIEAIVKGAINKPKSCLIDGIQLSTGCTYGKGNIQKMNSKAVVGLFHNLKNNKKIRISLKKDLVDELNNLKGHHDSKIFARKLFKTNPLSLFELKF